MMNHAHFDDVTLLARRAGIPYAVLVEPALRATFEALVPMPQDQAAPHVPLFHLLVPLRFVLGRNRTERRFEFVVGRRLCAGGVAVQAEFCRQESGDYLLALSARPE